MGRLFVYYEDSSPYGEYGVRFLAWRESPELTPDRVLPRLSGFASWFLPKPKQDRLGELEDRLAAVERLLPGGYYGALETCESILRALPGGRSSWR